MEMEMETANEGEEERDWTCLPPEMLILIAKCLREISDFVGFRIVCHAWRSSTSIADFPMEFPWILDGPCNQPFHPGDPNSRFYSLLFNKTYTITAPTSLDKKTLSGPCSHGYMPTLLQGSFGFRPISLLNPLTNHEIPVPAYPYVYDCHWIGPRQNQIGEYVIVWYGQSHYHNPNPILFFCHPGQNNWHRLNLGSDYRDCRHFYLKGMLFSVQRGTGVTKVTSITDSATLAYVVPPVEGYSAEGSRQYIVEDSLGDILRISRKYCSFPFNIRLDVYRLHVLNKNDSSPCWVKVSSIGNQAIFIDMDNAFVLRADELSDIKKNSIYLLMQIFLGLHSPPCYRADRIDIETGASEYLPCPLEKPKSWFLPNLHHL
ncbi:hypothetical protein LUZ61_003917 [Rhynchospora tenuis]|uniref:KIB1-4 beta-propeller domain-containing protein n=1 Tax=Rhynchospora tenuis TaxID=198213 RepID=A0AAD6ET48_9POAL|nr:hypothetical protein LUZ61_003917 [Rhynchospora tenuis]